MDKFEVTVAMLRKKKACPDQVVLFREVFGDSAQVNLRNVRKARKAGLDVGWVTVLLPQPLRDEYEAAMTSLWDEYEEAVRPLSDKYEAAIDRLIVEFMTEAAEKEGE